jgi:hypothetical protein
MALVAMLLVQVWIVLPVQAKKSVRQEVSGEIMVGTPDCSKGIHRRAHLLFGGSTNGVTAYRFDVDSKTWNRPFVLEATPGVELAGTDLMLVFYYGDLGAPTDDDPRATLFYEHKGGETGYVPADATEAFVLFCQGSTYLDNPSAGLQAAFTYVAEGRKQVVPVPSASPTL